MKQLLIAAAAALCLAACTKSGMPAMGPAKAAGAALAPSTVVASYQGKQVTLGELDTSIAPDLYALRRQNLETMIIRNLVQQEAAKAGQGEEDFLKAKSEKLVGPVSEAEARQLYEENKQALGGRSFEEMKPMLEARMRQQKEKDAMLAWFNELKKNAGVKITLPEPRVTVAATGPSKGPDGAPITIVEFSDFQCPYCAKARQTAEQALTAYAGKVRLVFRDYPLPFHDKAQKAAEAGQCANEQGKFWNMHDWMFDHQDKLDPAELKEGAKSIGLDPAKFDSCLDSGKFATAVKDSSKAGQEAGVSGTPAFFINGKMLSGAQPFEKFKEAIEDELSKN